MKILLVGLGCGEAALTLMQAKVPVSRVNLIFISPLGRGFGLLQDVFSLDSDSYPCVLRAVYSGAVWLGMMTVSAVI